MIKIKQSIKFGSTKREVNDLAHKIITKEKTATSSLLDYYREGLKEISSVDDYMSILDYDNNQIAIVRVIKTEIVKIGNISESFAIEEGDGSLANWKAIHYPYYCNQLSAIGKELKEDTELVCEWFELVSMQDGLII